MPRRARLVGTNDGALRSLLADLLAEQDVELMDGGPPDVVLALVDRGDVADVIAAATKLGSPVIALMGYSDDPLVASLHGAGIELVHSLETPIARLRELVRRTLATSRRPRRRWPRRWRRA